MPRKLTANELNRRITLQKKGRTEDDSGYPLPNPEWDDVITVWANREPLRGREFFAAAASHAEGTVRYKIRFRKGITSDLRLLDLKDNLAYEITAVLDDVFDDRTETHLMTEVLSNG